MKKSIIMFILFSLLINSVGASIENNYYLELKYDNGEIILKSLQIGLSKDGRDLNPLYLPAVIEPQDMLADNTRARKILSWKPEISFDEGLKILYDSLLKKGL